MDFLQVSPLAQTALALFDIMHTLFDSAMFKYAETIVALITIVTVLATTVVWLWKKIFIPIARALSHISDMYSTHEFVLSEIAKMQGIVPLIKELDSQHKTFEATITKAIEQADVTCLKANLLYEESPIARYECDMDGKCIWTNSALQKMWGMNESQLLGFGWLSGLHPEDVKRVEQDWMDTVEHWVPYRARYRIVHPETGFETTVDVSAQVIFDRSNRPVCIWGRAVKAKSPREANVVV